MVAPRQQQPPQQQQEKQREEAQIEEEEERSSDMDDWPEYYSLKECEGFLDSLAELRAEEKKENLKLREEILRVTKREAPAEPDSVKYLERLLLANSHA